METESIGKLIKTHRKEKGLSQKQLAELLQVSATTISKWETGVNLPDVLILKRMAEELNLSQSSYRNNKTIAVYRGTLYAKKA